MKLVKNVNIKVANLLRHVFKFYQTAYAGISYNLTPSTMRDINQHGVRKYFTFNKNYPTDFIYKFLKTTLIFNSSLVEKSITIKKKEFGLFRKYSNLYYFLTKYIYYPHQKLFVCRAVCTLNSPNSFVTHKGIINTGYLPASWNAGGMHGCNYFFQNNNGLKNK